MENQPTHFLWTLTDEITKRRRQTRYRMTEQEARARHGDDAVKVEGSGVTYTRHGSTSDFQKRELED